jgi:hypothetical protein
VAERFVLFQELRGLGVTEYVLQLVPFSRGRIALCGAALSMATDRGGGFVAADMETVSDILPALSLAAYRIGLSRFAAEALGAYLGPQTGGRVLQGMIQRGQSQTISAALLLADLRGFTALADRAPAAASTRRFRTGDATRAAPGKMGRTRAASATPRMSRQEKGLPSRGRRPLIVSIFLSSARACHDPPAKRGAAQIRANTLERVASRVLAVLCPELSGIAPPVRTPSNCQGSPSNCFLKLAAITAQSRQFPQSSEHEWGTISCFGRLWRDPSWRSCHVATCWQ